MKTNFILTQIHPPLLKKIPSKKLLPKFITALLALLLHSALFAQSALPSADRCTSKDLLLVGASIVNPGEDCNCVSGTRNLRLTINNKTGSERTSFAAWGKLYVDGSPTIDIFACGGPIDPKSLTEVVTDQQINYTCGTTLEIRDLFLAWTSASPNETCDVLEADPGGISPKCGTLGKITVDVGDVPAAPNKIGNLTECQESPTQTLDASNRVSVPSGITVTWYNQLNGGSVVSSPTLSSPGMVTYYAEASNGVCTSPRTPVTLKIIAAPSAPNSNGDITECQESPIQTLDARDALTSNTGVTWYTASSGGSPVTPTWSQTGSKTYYAQYSDGTCTSLSRTPVKLTIDPAPPAPTSNGDIRECEESSIQTLDARDALTSNTGVSWYTASSGGSPVTPTWSQIGSKTYYAEASLGNCKSLTRTPVKLTIDPTPPAPTSNGDITECQESPIQTLDARDALTSNTGVSWYTASSGGSPVTPTWSQVGSKTYYAEASLGNCPSLTRTPVKLTINALPAAPEICVNEPSLCGPAKGSIEILAPKGANYKYSINGGSSYQSGTTFLNLAAGSNPVVIVQNTATTCVSAPSNCNDYANCNASAKIIEPEELPAVKPAIVERSEMMAENPEIPFESPEIPELQPEIPEVPISEISVKAFPNPFNNEIRFNVNIPEASKGRLELVNTLGQTVKTVFDGSLNEGMNAFEVNIPSEGGTSTLYYILYVGDQQITGKLLRTIGND